MKQENNLYKRITLKLSEDSYKLLSDQSKEKKRDKVIGDALFFYSHMKNVSEALLDAIQTVKQIKIFIEYIDFNSFGDEKDITSPYKRNYRQVLDSLAQLERNLQEIRIFMR